MILKIVTGLSASVPELVDEKGLWASSCPLSGDGHLEWETHRHVLF